jgi:integrase
MMTPASPTVSKEEQFAKALLHRLARRATVDGVVYTLDLRAKQFDGAPSKRITLRAPDAPGWPDLGRTTDDEAEARRWVEENYAKWLLQEVRLNSVNPDGPRTVREAAERFVKTLAVTRRAPDGTDVEDVRKKDQSLVSMIRSHVVPRLGHFPIAALTPEKVGEEAEALTVTKKEGLGVKSTAPAAYGTKRRFLAALSAIWRSNYPYRPIPWQGVRIKAETVEARDSDEVSGFDDESGLLGDEDTGALTPDELFSVLVAAMWMDLKRLQDPKLQHVFIPNTAHAIAIQAAHGPRISEAANLRWGHIFSKGYLILQNAKQHQVIVKKRALPVQHSAVPWFDDLREMEGASLDPNGYVIRTDARGGPFKKAALTTLAKRISDAHIVAGVKQPGKATHGLRATFASHADNNPDIDGKTLQRYLGHHRVHGKSTDEYLRQMISMMKESHRHIIELPSPEAVRAAVADFVPAVPLPHWKERKRPQSRTNAAKAERRAKGPRRPLGVSLDIPSDRHR